MVELGPETLGSTTALVGTTLQLLGIGTPQLGLTLQPELLQTLGGWPLTLRRKQRTLGELTTLSPPAVGEGRDGFFWGDTHRYSAVISEVRGRSLKLIGGCSWGCIQRGVGTFMSSHQSSGFYHRERAQLHTSLT